MDADAQRSAVGRQRDSSGPYAGGLAAAILAGPSRVQQRGTGLETPSVASGLSELLSQEHSSFAESLIFYITHPGQFQNYHAALYNFP